MFWMLHLTLRPNWWNGVCRSFLTKRNQGNWIRGFQDVRASLKPTPHGDAGRSFQMPRKYQQRCHHHQGPEVYQDCLGVFWNYRNHTKLVLKTFKKLSSEWVPSECSKSRYFGELYLLTPKIPSERVQSAPIYWRIIPFIKEAPTDQDCKWSPGK